MSHTRFAAASVAVLVVATTLVVGPASARNRQRQRLSPARPSPPRRCSTSPSAASSISSCSVGARRRRRGRRRVLDLNVGALAEQLRSAATGATQLVNLNVLGGVLDVSGVTSALTQGSQSDRAAVARSMHVDAVSFLSLGSLFELLGVPLTSLSLEDLGTLASSLGVPVAGLPGGATLAGFTQPLLDTLSDFLTQQSSPVGALTQPVQGVITGLLGSTPASDTLVQDLPGLPTLVTDLIDQITDRLTGLLGDLANTSLVKLNAIDLSVVATAVGTLAGSSANASCTLGSVQIASLPSIDLGVVTSVIGQIGAVTSQLPFGLGDLLDLSVCGVRILGPAPEPRRRPGHRPGDLRGGGRQHPDGHPDAGRPGPDAFVAAHDRRWLPAPAAASSSGEAAPI